MTRPWQIALDVGGTFTDAVAVSPAGRVHTAKVLSSGLIRTTITIDHAGLNANLPNVPTVAGFLSRASIRLLHGPSTDAVVIDTDEPVANGTRQLRLLQPIPAEWPRGTPCPAIIDPRKSSPALAAHLLTSTPLARPLPPTEVRLGTTRGTNALLEGTGAPIAPRYARSHVGLIAKMSSVNQIRSAPCTSASARTSAATCSAGRTW